VLYSAGLAYISHFVIHAWCLFCISLYVVNAGIFALGWNGAGGPGGALKSLSGGGRAFAMTLGIFAVAFAGSWGIYSQQKDVRVAESTAKALATPKPVPVNTTATPAIGPIDPTKGQEKDVRLGEARQDVHIPKDAPSLGPIDAKVQVAVFSDFQCPFCKRLASTLHQLHDEFPKEVRVAYMYFPMNQDCNTSPTLTRTMHPEACHAAVAASCAHQQGKFWDFHDKLFAQQGNLGAPYYTESAQGLGLDSERFASCQTDPSVVDGIKANTVEGGKLGINGTPGIFLNGRMMSGAQPIEVLRAVVQAELSGQTGALALKVLVGAEEVGTVQADPTVPVPGMSGVSIDTFEASKEGGSAASKAGAQVYRGVSWYDAKTACEAAGKRLCTESEWLSACTGTLPTDGDRNGIYSDETIVGQLYGYGSDWHSGSCADSRNPDAAGDILAGNHPKCKAASGAYDMVGNVKEWVGLTPADAGVKGGSYTSGESARCGYYRDDLSPWVQDPTIGFRCCSGPAPALEADKPGRQVGDALASFKVSLLDGGSFDSSKLKGHPAIVTFWASWCGPCRKELPALANLYNKYKDQGLMVLGISVDKTPDPAKVFVTSQSLPFLIGHDPSNDLFNSFDTRGLPTTFWIQKDGKIRLRTVGIPPGAEKRLEELATELMGS
jgi:protein-disulfide isomerase/peroxiredoxin